MRAIFFFYQQIVVFAAFSPRFKAYTLIIYLNSFDFPPYIKKIDISSLFDLLSCRGECPYKKKSFSLSVERVGGNCGSVQVYSIISIEFSSLKTRIG